MITTNATQSRPQWSQNQYFCIYSVNIKVFGGESGPAATLAPKLGPLGLVLFSPFRMPRRSVKISLRREANGKEFVWWSSLNAKTELLKSLLTPAHLPCWSRNLETTKETERKSRTLTTKETSLLNKSRKSQRLLKRNRWPKTFQEQSSQSSEPAFPLAALLTSKAPSKLSPKSTTTRSKFDCLAYLNSLSSKKLNEANYSKNCF